MRSAGLVAKCTLLLVLALCPTLIHLTLASKLGAQIAATFGIARLVDIGLVATSALIHTSIYLALLVMFGTTLLPGRQPFITALSRKMYGGMSDERARYTRGVTWAWVLFFVSQLMTSLLLYLFAPIFVWSLFVNVLTLPLVALMFAAEYAYRATHLQDAPRHSLADLVRMVGYIRAGATRQAGTD